MHKSNSEKLSLLFDDQLDSTEAYNVLKLARQNAEMQSKLQRYALISQAFKGEQCSVASLDFVDNIHQQLKQEPIYLLPRKKDNGTLKKAGLAVAASLVLAVFWLSANHLQSQLNPLSGSNTIAKRSLDSEQMNARFKEYLQAHDNVWYVNNNVGVQSYARVASYQQE